MGVNGWEFYLSCLQIKSSLLLIVYIFDKTWRMENKKTFLNYVEFI